MNNTTDNEKIKKTVQKPCRNRAVTLPKAAQMQINQGVLAKV